jgi:class 3 adenylate cyclase
MSSRPVVVVFADIAGSTALYEALGNERATEAVTVVVNWLGDFIRGQGGRVVKTLGDGVLGAFAEVPHAAGAMAALMRGHQQNLQLWPPEARLQVRVGMAVGEVVEVDGDCYGDAVNLAARLCERSGPGEVWMDGPAAREAGSGHDARFVRLGGMDIRGKSEPVTVYGLEWRLDEDPDSQTMQAHLPSTLGALPEGGTVQIQMQWSGGGRVYGPGEMPLQVGRAREAPLCLDDPRVSRQHARIDWRGGSFVLTDLSRFGTWVRFEGGEPVLLRRDACLLHGRGQIALGVPFGDASAPTLEFQVSEAGVRVE